MVDSAFHSPAMARQYLQHGCSSYLTYVVDTRVEGNKSISEVPLIREFLNFLLEDLPGVSLVRQIEFMIDLIHGTTLTAKGSSRLAPLEM